MPRFIYPRVPGISVFTSPAILGVHAKFPLLHNLPEVRDHPARGLAVGRDDIRQQAVGCVISRTMVRNSSKKADDVRREGIEEQGIWRGKMVREITHPTARYLRNSGYGSA